MTEDEQQLFARLGVFVGGCTLEAAAAICGSWESGGGSWGAESPPTPSSQLPTPILDGLAALVDQSLLRQEEGAEGEPRFTMLETIREYALERLAASGEEDAIRQRHAAYYLVLAEAAEPELEGPRQLVWLRRLELEHDNVRVALSWSQAAAGDTEVGLRLAGAMGYFWWVRGHYSEGRRWLETALTLGDNSKSSARAKALLGAASLADMLGDHRCAKSFGEESLTLYREQGDKRGIASAYHELGWRALERTDNPEAETCFAESLALSREQGDKRGIAWALNGLGWAAKQQNDDARAVVLTVESLALRRELGDLRGIAVSLHNLGWMTFKRGDTAQARALFAEGLVLDEELGHKTGIVDCFIGLAGVAGAQRQLERTAQLLGMSVALRNAIGEQISPADRARYEDVTAIARAHLGEEAFAAAWAAGRAMPLEQAIAYALEDMPPLEQSPSVTDYGIKV